MYTMIFRGNKTKHTQNVDKNENITKLLKTLGKCHMLQYIYIAYRVV